MNKRLAVCAVAALGILAGAVWFLRSPGTITSTDAVVEGRLVAVGLDVSGVVKEVYVCIGDAVAKDQPLLALDPLPYERQLAQERARLAEIASKLPPGVLVPSPGSSQSAPEKSLTTLRAEEDDARSRMEAAAQASAQAEITLARIRATNVDQAAPERQAARIARDEAAANLKKARDDFEKVSYARAQRERQDGVDKASGVVSGALASLLAEYHARISQVRLAEQSLAATVLISPESGTVFLLAAQSGRSLTAGESPVAVLPENNGDLWVFAEFIKADKDRLLPGTECEVALEGVAAPLKAKLGDPLPGQETEKTVAVRVILDQDALPDWVMPGKTASVSLGGGKGNFFDTLWRSDKKPK